jgi:hypothetical protein
MLMARVRCTTTYADGASSREEFDAPDPASMDIDVLEAWLGEYCSPHLGIATPDDYYSDVYGTYETEVLDSALPGFKGWTHAGQG